MLPRPNLQDSWEVPGHEQGGAMGMRRGTWSPGPLSQTIPSAPGALGPLLQHDLPRECFSLEPPHLSSLTSHSEQTHTEQSAKEGGGGCVFASHTRAPGTRNACILHPALERLGSCTSSVPTLRFPLLPALRGSDGSSSCIPPTHCMKTWIQFPASI